MCNIQVEIESEDYLLFQQKYFVEIDCLLFQQNHLLNIFGFNG